VRLGVGGHHNPQAGSFACLGGNELCRVPAAHDLPGGVDMPPLQLVDRIGNDIALRLKLALRWKQAGMLQAEGRASDAGHAQHVNLRASIARQLGGLGNRMSRDPTAFGGKQDRSCCDPGARVRVPTRRPVFPSSLASFGHNTYLPHGWSRAEPTRVTQAKRAFPMSWSRGPGPRPSSTDRTAGRRRARPTRPNSRSPRCRAASR
jgi:hypothetical protein